MLFTNQYILCKTYSDRHKLFCRWTVTYLATRLLVLINFYYLLVGQKQTKSYQTISKCWKYYVRCDKLLSKYSCGSKFRSSSDSMAFNKYRQEVCYGTPLSVEVIRYTKFHLYTNSKTVYLLTYPTQNWNQYLINATTLDWSKIAVGGHSQGGGHACYFAKI